ncbi:MAG: hypothetical protein IH624_10100 [Phycisphaerae bacterium]|nr:hypothetical protein [Phycisphaerae bacterium]
MKKLLKYFLALLVLLFMLTLIEVLYATAGYAAMKYPACVHYGTRTLIITSLCAFFMAFVWLLAGGSARSHGRTARSITALGTVTAFLALLWIAALGMFGGQGLTKIPRAFREKLKGEEFPLAYIGGLAIADDGRIYLSNQQYGTIQAYKNNGVFLRSWFVETCGNYEIWIKDGRLSTYEHRTQLILRWMVF